MWQIHALMAQGQIDEQLREAAQRRRGRDLVREPRHPRRMHLRGMLRHAGRSSRIA